VDKAADGFNPPVLTDQMLHPRALARIPSCISPTRSTRRARAARPAGTAHTAAEVGSPKLFSTNVSLALAVKILSHTGTILHPAEQILHDMIKQHHRIQDETRRRMVCHVVVTCQHVDVTVAVSRQIQRLTEGDVAHQPIHHTHRTSNVQHRAPHANVTCQHLYQSP
jgi:hypothetical protein